jgi:hypothetical protein
MAATPPMTAVWVSIYLAMEPPKDYMDTKGMVVTPTTPWSKSSMPCQDAQVRVVGR